MESNPAGGSGRRADVHGDEPGSMTASVSGSDSLPAWTLVRAAHLAGRRFHEVFASEGITAHQFGVLVALSEQPGVSQAALARAILVTPQSIGDILTQMDATGLVHRTAPPRRGTAACVRITARGLDAMRRTYPRVRALNTPEALGLDPDEARALSRLLGRVHDHLDDREFRPLPDGV